MRYDKILKVALNPMFKGFNLNWNSIPRKTKVRFAIETRSYSNFEAKAWWDYFKYLKTGTTNNNK